MPLRWQGGTRPGARVKLTGCSKSAMIVRFVTLFPNFLISKKGGYKPHEYLSHINCFTTFAFHH